MIYLASPYTHPDSSIMEARFDAACRAAGELMRQRNHVFSPIAHTHPIAVRCELPVEPFFGSGAVLLERPQPFEGVETVNDLNGWLANFWRALQADPDAVAHYADWPVSETVTLRIHTSHATYDVRGIYRGLKVDAMGITVACLDNATTLSGGSIVGCGQFARKSVIRIRVEK